MARIETRSIQDLFLHELAKTQQLESQVEDLLQKMGSNVKDEELSGAIEDHKKETSDHIKNIEEAFRMLDREPKEKRLAVIDGLAKERREMSNEVDEPKMEDAISIIHAIKAEHVEMAQYDTLLSLAEQAGIDEDVRDLLRENKEDEQNTLERMEDIVGGDRSLLDRILKPEN